MALLIIMLLMASLRVSILRVITSLTTLALTLT
jgi:hypothetical protein